MKKIFTSMMVLCLATQAQAADFATYREMLENDLTCASYPKTDLNNHLRLLKEVGAISKDSTMSKGGKPSTFKVASGINLFGAPLVSVTLVPGDKNIPAAAILAVVSAKPKDVAKVVAVKAKKRGVVLHKPEGYEVYSGENEQAGFSIEIQTVQGGAEISCSTWMP